MGEWKKVLFSDVADFINGGSWSQKEYANDGITVVRVSDIQGGRVKLKDCKYLNKAYREKYKKHRIKLGDLLISTVGSHPSQPASAVGKTAIAKKGSEGAYLNQNAVIVRAKRAVSDSLFLGYLGRGKQLKSHVANYAKGSANHARMSIGDLKNFSFGLPSLPEQKRIASILSALDDKIELNLQMNQTLEQMAMALYKHWFVDFGPFKDGEFVDSELGRIPKGWKVKTLLQVVDLLSGGTPKTKVKEYWNGDICWVSAKDIGGTSGFMIVDTERKITQLGIEKSAAKILPKNTVIVVARGSVGKFGVIAREMAMNQSCYGVYGKEGYGQPWVYLTIAKLIKYLQSVAYGSVFDTITTSTFKNTKTIVPQKDQMEVFAKLVGPLFQKIERNTLENQTLSNLRDTLLPKLISGKIRLEVAQEQVEEAVGEALPKTEEATTNSKDEAGQMKMDF